MVELPHHKRSLHTKGGGTSILVKHRRISGFSLEKGFPKFHTQHCGVGWPSHTRVDWILDGISCEIDPTPPMLLTNLLLELSRRSVDPWVEENIVTMLQLGAIKKIHMDFFSRVLILSRMERGKDYGKRFILDLKTVIQISHQKILKNQRTKVSSWSLKMLYTKRPESYWKPSCVYIVQISVEKDAPYIQANARTHVPVNFFSEYQRVYE